ncbi:hypothetical protein L249_1839 [Ophiocordyceps polyrhachis-furcata BCC 54312]|uniref:N-acetyltransferase domain-containing protein n=1 Tax=Ophiocordyceps polyrhachis-furcata BCC 54312 TaxID=1330021 RepID=A0A367LNS9_9HYPO|nr:hypothetical protein L249_1839 [Ophiocordyceps polyrhachis-furcata BCC 54312]
MKNKNSNKTSIRPATMADVPAMSSLVCTSLAEEAAWKRLCPPKQEVESLLAEAMTNRRKHVMVLEDDTNGVVVSASVWEEADEQRHPSTAALSSCTTADDDKDDKAACLALRLLATRPDCQRRGYGRALASWGVRRAGKRSVPVCVLAAERGYILFSGMGFVDRGLVSLGGGGADDDEDGDVCVKTMVLQPLPSRRLRVAKLLSLR